MSTLRLRRRRAARFAGFTLIECLVYISLLMLILGMGLAAFYRAHKQTIRLGRNAADILRAVDAGERWRADIRAATGPVRWSDLAGGRELHVPGAAGEIAYAFRENAVWRRTDSGEPWMAVLPQVRASAMIADARRHATAWRWDLELMDDHRVARVKPRFTFLAVPGFQSSP